MKPFPLDPPSREWSGNGFIRGLVFLAETN